MRVCSTRPERLRPWLLLLGVVTACADAPPVVPPSAGVSSSSPSAVAQSPSAEPSASASAAAPPELPELPPPPAPDPPIRLASGGKAAVRGSAGIVSSVESHATRAGVEVLERGGNAIDAAVAVGFALAVTHPSAGNLGGGGFMIVKLRDGSSTAIDFREIAPKTVTTEKVLAEVAAGGMGWASTAVPGTVAGLELARSRYGKKPLAELVAPAIRLAEKGHPLSSRAAQALAWQHQALAKDPSAKAIFSKGKDPLREGDRLVQKDLAKTLRAIAERGQAGFYEGEVAEAITRAMKAGGGDVTKEDLAAYQAKLREPLRFGYRGFDVETMPPPSMGGIAVAQILTSMERLGAHQHAAGDAEWIHLFVESAKHAYAERRTVGSDPDFWGEGLGPERLRRMIGGRYLEARKPSIDASRANPSTSFAAGGARDAESPETTHYSVVDAEGNAVSCTVTLSASFGAKVIAPGTGVIFSNALGAFSPDGPNAAAPHKRMASSMSPTVLSRGGKPLVVIGSPGGDTIPNTVAQAIAHLVDHGMTVDRAVLAGRVHHQLLPDQIRIERSREPSKKAQDALKAKGHAIVNKPMPLGDVKAIVIDEVDGTAYGYADPREGGLALAAKPAKPAKR